MSPQDHGKARSRSFRMPVKINGCPSMAIGCPWMPADVIGCPWVSMIMSPWDIIRQAVNQRKENDANNHE